MKTYKFKTGKNVSVIIKYSNDKDTKRVTKPDSIFGFKTHLSKGYRDILYYTVELPHSCDKWKITEVEEKEEAIKDMEQFIKEASEALTKLIDLKVKNEKG